VATERILPEIAVGAGPAHASAGTEPRPRVWSAASGSGRILPEPAISPAAEPKVATAKAARLAKPRGAALLSRTTRAGMLIGVSAGVYAVSLATVSGLQAQAQAEVAAQNRPAIDALNQARAANDALAASIQDADAQIRAMADQYNSVSQDMTTYQAKFDNLSTLVAKIRGSAAALNAKIKLPSVSIHGAIGGGGGGGTTYITTTAASGKP
jgi:hypothetical protein